MALCVAPTSDGTLVIDSAEPCEAYQLLTFAEYRDLMLTTELWVPDWSFAQWVFGSVLLMFAVGVGIGLIVQQVRKLRV